MSIFKKQWIVMALLGVLSASALISCSSGESEPIEISTEKMLEEVWL